VAQLPQQLTLSAAIVNLTDEDPPFSRNELSYDPTTGSPLGRAVEIGIRKKLLAGVADNSR
jgi:iron complex outermembrane receptor protein